MRRILALNVMIAFIVSVASVNSAYAGWKENYREKYSKKHVDPNSPQGKKIRTMANMDFTYPEWKNPTGRSKGESSDKFTGMSTNFGPGNVGNIKEETRKTSGCTLTGILRDVGGAATMTGKSANKVKQSITSGGGRAETK